MKKFGVDLPVLIGQSGPLNGQRWAIDGALTIGRDEECDIIVPDRQISRYHARIEPDENGSVHLEDLGSKNGTFVNGTSVVDPVVLQDGDLLQLALVQHFVFLSSDATIPLEGSGLSLSGQVKGARLSLDQGSRRVWIGGHELVPPLSLPQFRLLELLYGRQGQVVERQELIDSVWKDDFSEGVSEQAFDALVRRLRDRLAMVNPEHVYLATVRGHGIRLDNPTD